MNRRTFIEVMGGGLLAAPLAAAAQPAPRWRVGVLFVLLSPTGKEAQAFRQGLQSAGHVEGRDVVIEWRSADGDYTRLLQLAAELVERRVDVIVADTTQATQAARHASSTIPIVMAIVADPVGSGVVANLSQPGGNITGLSIMLAELSAKRLQLLRDAVPRVTRVAVLWNPPTGYHTKAIDNLKAVAPSLAIELTLVSARTAEEVVRAVELASRARAEALYVMDCPPFFTHRGAIVQRAMKARLPVVSGERPYTEVGALMSYGPRYEDQLRRSAEYVDRILKGAKPSDLPIEQPSKFELVINLKTARELHLPISPALLQRADQVIE